MTPLYSDVWSIGHYTSQWNDRQTWSSLLTVDVPRPIIKRRCAIVPVHVQVPGCVHGGYV
ncbi:MAG TPA: hypothetical protein DEF43_11600 [Chloroflexus aurantiacus]|nr:MAG: hypothetical protein D6716_03295 [Chloroflexota bacterium]HBW67782.1 hypothetical protein [Chloroflexus aurantiacus]